MTQASLFEMPKPTPCDCTRGVWAAPYMTASDGPAPKDGGCFQEPWSCEACQMAGCYSTRPDCVTPEQRASVKERV